LPVKLDSTSNGEFEPVPLSETIGRANADAAEQIALNANRRSGVLKGKKGDSAHGLLVRKWLESFYCGNGKTPAHRSLLL
jgi:hypothetical protein